MALPIIKSINLVEGLAAYFELLKLYEMNSNERCSHEGEQLMVCTFAGCKAEDLGACFKCVFTGPHQHELYAIHSLAIRNKITQVMNVIHRKNELEQLVARYYAQQRRRVLERLQQEQEHCMGRLEGLIDRGLATSFAEIDAGNLRDRKLVQRILEGRLPTSPNLADNLAGIENQIMEVMHSDTNNDNGITSRKRPSQSNYEEQNPRSMKKVHRDETVLTTTTALVRLVATKTERQAQLLEEIQRLEQADIDDTPTKPAQSTNEQPIRQQVAPQPQVEKEKPFEQSIPILLIPESSQESIVQELPPEATYKEMQFSSFLEASSVGTSNQQLLSIWINFVSQPNQPTKAHYNQHRANISDFLQCLKKLTHTTALKLRIGPQCSLNKWNLQQIDTNLKMLPRLKSFELEYSPQNADAAKYEFVKLAGQGVSIVACPLNSE